MPPPSLSKIRLDRLYRQYNDPRYVEPDPLQFLYAYPDVRDREIVALIASCLAYGRVVQILRSVRRVLDRLGPTPHLFLEGRSAAALERCLSGFKHRFTTHRELAAVLAGVRRVNLKHGSLNACFCSGVSRSDRNVLPALTDFVREIHPGGGHLLPSPAGGSACKRLNLFLRWMVRRDRVDPGGWTGVPRAKLIMPLDTHIARIGARFRLTRRRSPNMGMALEITDFFRELAPRDPVKYDFALTRFGIRGELDPEELLA